VWWNAGVVMVLIFGIISDNLQALEFYSTRILRIQNFPVNFSQELLINSSRYATSDLDYSVYLYFKAVSECRYAK
jgi:hypothetical protein